MIEHECPTCERIMPDEYMEEHHLKTRRKDIEDTIYICRECHKSVHGLFSNKMLRDEELGLDTIEGLMENRRFLKAVKYIKTLEPGTFMKMKDSRKKKRNR